MFLLWPLLRQMPRESVVQLPCNIFRVCVLDTHSLRFVAWRSGVLSHSVKNGKIPVSCDQEKTPLFLSRLSLQCLQDILLDFLSSNSICSALYSSFHVFFFNLDILSWESLSQDTFSYLFSFFGCSCKVRGAAELVIYPKSPLCQVCLSSLPVFVCLFFFSLQLSFCVYLFLHPLCPLCVLSSCLVSPMSMALRRCLLKLETHDLFMTMIPRLIILNVYAHERWSWCCKKTIYIQWFFLWTLYCLSLLCNSYRVQFEDSFFTGFVGGKSWKSHAWSEGQKPSVPFKSALFLTDVTSS